MNLRRPEKIVLLGFLSHFPVAGVAWQTLHYLVGLRRLGYDVYYVEAHGCTPSKLMRTDDDDGPVRAAEYIASVLSRYDLGDKWAYHALYESRYFGMSELQLKELYRSADLIINLHGSHLPTADLTATNRLIYLETDPVDVQIDVFHEKKEVLDYLSPHCAFFTYGENLGRPDCLLPTSERFKFRPTRQPVIMDFWKDYGRGSGEAFTTIGNWRQPWRQATFRGQTYTWSKHSEFLKFINLPSQRPQPFELALASYEPADQKQLETKGWRVRPSLSFSQDLDAYRDYIGASRGEFTVAKDQNIRLRSGWFSDRAITYLAAGRPVITQETAFSNILPTGAGLFAFSTMSEILAAVDAINSDYERHRKAAWEIAQDCFGHDVVLGQLLDDVGMRRPGQPTRPAPAVGSKSALPDDLILTPTGRWPTRLPEATQKTALALSAPKVAAAGPAQPSGASIIVVTHNGLMYTKMCLTSLLGTDWRDGDELIVVDNASTDGTPDYLREIQRNNPFVQVLLNECNLGFAAANNQGLNHAGGQSLVLLNNDTLVTQGWQNRLVGALSEPQVGLVGPVTNRTCNEAQIDAPYRTHRELGAFAQTYTTKHQGQGNDIRMLAMFCVAFRRDLWTQIGPLDERFGLGMFEDDDYARRVRDAGYRIVCREDVYIHHFGQASFGELCTGGDYDGVFETNRRRFEEKWGAKWEPHARRLTPEYQSLRQRIKETVQARLPAGASIVVVSKGDEQLVDFPNHQGAHFPQLEDGGYANVYPAHSEEAIQQLEALRARGGRFLLVPQPAFWWLEHYGEFRTHLESRYPVTVRDEATCLVFDLGGAHA